LRVRLWHPRRRAQHAHAQSLTAGIRTIRHRLSLPVGEPGRSGRPGGYRSRQEWHAKARRLTVLEARLAAVEADRAAGHVSVVRGGKRLLNKRHNLDAAGLTEVQWRQEWEATRWFLSADGESGKRCGNETIRVTLDGEVSLRLPAPLTHLANAPHGRYVLTGRVTFGHRGDEWRDRLEANRAVAYRIHHNPGKNRWYLDASWQRKDTTVVPLETLRAGEVIGVDMNADHLAAWRLDTHGNPTGKPRTFAYDLTGTATRRDAQVRHALTRLLHWAKQSQVLAIAVEDLDFTDSKTREQHGRRKRFRQLVSGMPTSRLRTRLLAMTAEAGIAVIAVDPAYTSRWGAQHWQKPTSTPPTRPPDTRQPPSRSGDAPSGTRSGDGRHRPDSTRWMLPGIGPSRPDQAPQDARRPATQDPDHGHDPCRRPGPRTRATRRPNTVRGRPPTRTHS
jgi:IS605 OrfB family transposase